MISSGNRGGINFIRNLYGIDGTVFDISFIQKSDNFCKININVTDINLIVLI